MQEGISREKEGQLCQQREQLPLRKLCLSELQNCPRKKVKASSVKSVTHLHSLACLIQEV